jgi:hypothetical protein
VGEATEVLARLLGEDRQPITDVQFEWTVADDNIARVDARGGQAHISAVSAGKTMVTVLAGPDLRRSAEVIVESKWARKRQQARANLGSFTERVLTGAVAIVLLTLVRMGPQIYQRFQGSPPRDVGAPPPKSSFPGPTFRAIHRSTGSVSTSSQPAVPEVTPRDEAFEFPRAENRPGQWGRGVRVQGSALVHP